MRKRGIYFAGMIGIMFSAAVMVQGLVLSDNTVIKKVPTTHKVVALSLDDGPHYKTTPQILKVLKEKNVKVTFFVLGQNAQDHPEIVAQELADGHEIASHAYSHRLLTKLSQKEVAEELDKTEKTIIAAKAPQPTLFRPPGGAYNDSILEEARQRGYMTVIWSVDPGDWRRPSVASVVETIMTQVQPGSIVLLHDGQYPLPTGEALGIVIDKLREQGYSIVPISELLQYYEERN